MTLGDPLTRVERCETTQALLDATMLEGATVVADEQTAGRGRLGRTWEAPAGSALLFSVLLKPPPERRPQEISLVAAVAVADTLERELDLAVQIKWPNDVMVRRTKVAGILAELRDGAVVLGIGLNVNQTRDQLPERGGSLRTVDGRERDRDALLHAVLGDLDARYREWLDGGLEAVYEGLAPRDFLRGRRVSVNGTDGTAELIDRAGRLELRTDAGEVVHVESGEVVYER